MIKTLHRNSILRFIEILEDGFVVFLFAAIASISLLQIILRNFFDTGFSWATPMLGILLLWLTLSGAVVAVRKDRHISINILACHLAPLTGCMVFAITKIFTALVCALVAFYGVRLVQLDLEQGSILFSNVPAWACELIIPISFSLLSVRFFIAVIEEIHQFKKLQAS
jgi:TRAP-type C4-dicarboxylate transport system permease small subunit